MEHLITMRLTGSKTPEGPRLPRTIAFSRGCGNELSLEQLERQPFPVAKRKARRKNEAPTELPNVQEPESDPK
eukprot:11197409-Lingulodinium_polyedra.AAC.1